MRFTYFVWSIFIILSFSFDTKSNLVNPAFKSDTDFVELIKLDKSLILDLKYATKDNFTGKILYPCAKAYLRQAPAQALIQANKALIAKGLRIKIWDAYRPLSVQWKLWEMYPNPDYVADPRKGSMHNRGGAVDITLVDKNGKELDMGTPFDFFGPKAHPSYTNLSAKVRENRQILKNALESVGFSGIKTEWWHFAYIKQNFKVSNHSLGCK